MKKKIPLFILLISIALHISCATTYTARSTTPIDKRNYERLSKAAGTDSAWSLFGLWILGRVDILWIKGKTIKYK